MARMMERRIRWAGALIGCGLIIQMATFLWTHPIAFLTFLLIGCPLVGAGIFLFLISLVSHEPNKEVG